jgi:hypothetical protein
MTGVMLGQGVVPVLLLTVHGYVCPITGVGAVVGCPRGSLSCQRAPRVPLARRERAKGVRRFDDIMGAWTRRKMPPKAPILPETFPQGSGGIEVDLRASSD